MEENITTKYLKNFTGSEKERQARRDAAVNHLLSLSHQQPMQEQHSDPLTREMMKGLNNDR